MIEIEKAEKYRCCNVCYSQQKVFNITFWAKNTKSGTQVSLCEKCLNELKIKIAEQEDYEWCHDCKEYDQEKHCCHRWTKVIRQTVEEVKAQYALEYPKIIHCEECKFYTPMNRALKTGICSLTMHHLGDDGFCSDAEKRGD